MNRTLPGWVVALVLCTGPACTKSPPPIVSVADATSLHGRAGSVSFRDGVPRTDLLGSSSRFTYRVVPLVPEAWTPADPVTVWVLCDEGPKVGRCDDPTLWLESLAAQPLPLTHAKVIGHADATRSGTGWALSVHDAQTRYGVQSHPRAIFITVDEPAAWTPSRAPEPQEHKGSGLIMVVVFAMVAAVFVALAANALAMIRYEADRKKHGAHASRRALVAWALSVGCAVVWPTVLFIGPGAAIVGGLELAAVRAGKSPPASRIPAKAAIANGLGWFLLIVISGIVGLLVANTGG